ncbi:hypothetical protein [Psychroserpens luteolus]|uniref:hypothetical protein n=1 Tax=Psychroserpens luteolus TaxID=2855840 RepID=UPI001E60A314|nr:hypothetical protein [Psychroserpens luteolus]MCD2260211.1 hypothetical protein [Psychroserpens luteolus]
MKSLLYKNFILVGIICAFYSNVNAQIEYTPEKCVVPEGAAEKSIIKSCTSCKKSRAIACAEKAIADELEEVCRSDDKCKLTCTAPGRIWSGRTGYQLTEERVWMSRSENKECGIWPFKKRKWIVRIEAKYKCCCWCKSKTIRL